jgi:hypothetical protein
MRRILCFAASTLFLAGIFAAPGGEFWEKKEYGQWSQKECAKLLEDSPWSKLYTLTSVGIMAQAKGSTDANQPYIKYQVQFRSALPIRQALVRQNQIAAKYESLPPEQRQEFDKKAEAFLSGFPTDSVVVYVTYSANDRDNDQELARYWQSQTVELFKNSVYLSSTKGDKVPLANYAAGQGAQRSFQFIFPREMNGKPILDPHDKSLKLEFVYPVVAGIGDGKGFMEFKAEKMVFQGNIAY